MEQPDAGELKHHAARYSDFSTAPSPNVLIAKVGVGITEPGLTSIDFFRAAAIINEAISLDIRQRAADKELTRRTDREVVSREYPERTPEAVAAIRSDIEDEFPDLAEAAESGEYSEQALRTLLWQHDRS